MSKRAKPQEQDDQDELSLRQTERTPIAQEFEKLARLIRKSGKMRVRGNGVLGIKLKGRGRTVLVCFKQVVIGPERRYDYVETLFIGSFLPEDSVPRDISHLYRIDADDTYQISTNEELVAHALNRMRASQILEVIADV